MGNDNITNPPTQFADLSGMMTSIKSDIQDLRREIATMHAENQRTATAVNRIRLALDSARNEQSQMIAQCSRLEEAVLKRNATEQ